jgi:hypothetical protein
MPVVTKEIIHAKPEVARRVKIINFECYSYV